MKQLPKKELIALVLLFISIPVSVFLVFQRQEIRKRANVDSAIIDPETINPNRIIVKYKDGQSPEDLEKKISQRQAREKSFSGRLQNSLEDAGLLAQGEKTSEQKLNRTYEAKEKSGVLDDGKLYEKVNKNVRILQIEKSKNVQEAKRNYDALENIEYSAFDYKAPPPLIANDPLYSEMWNLERINVSKAWDITLGTKNILIGSIDTGVDYTHEDLPRDIINGFDFADGDSDSMDVSPNGHGTQVAGTINALINNQKGIAGIAPNARLLAIKVYDAEGGYSSAAAQGIVYAADYGAKVILLEMQSYPGEPCTSVPYYQEAIDYARAKNIAIVATAGNFDSDTAVISPASCPGLIVVGASGRFDERKYYSNWGDHVDISAPAEGIITTQPGNRYDHDFGGTSGAAPHVVATVALMLSVNPNLTPDEVERIIKTTGDSIITDKPIGNRLNTYKAVLAAAGLPIPTPTVNPTTSPAPTTTPTATPIPTQSPTSTPHPTSSPTTSKPGDTDGDGDVDIFDYNLVVEHFGPRMPASGSPADFDHDGDVDIFDYNILIENFGK